MNEARFTHPAFDQVKSAEHCWSKDEQEAVQRALFVTMKLHHAGLLVDSEIWEGMVVRKEALAAERILTPLTVEELDKVLNQSEPDVKVNQDGSCTPVPATEEEIARILYEGHEFKRAWDDPKINPIWHNACRREAQILMAKYNVTKK